MFKYPTKPIEIITVLEAGLGLSRRAFTRVWYWAFLSTLVSTLPQLDTVFSMPDPNEASWISLTLYILFLLGCLFVAAFFSGLLMWRINSHTDERGLPPLIKDIEFIKRKWLDIYLGMLIVSISTIVGLVMLIIPGLVIAVYLLFYLPIILLEDKHALTSLRDSLKMVTGFFWRSAGVLLVPTALIIAFLKFNTWIMGSGNQLGLVLGKIVVMSFLLPYFSSVILVYYNDVKLRRKLLR